MKKDIEDFKNDILFNEIHQTERSSYINENIEIAERFIRTNKEGIYNKKTWMTVFEMPMIINVFEIISGGILKHEKLLILIDELEEKEYQNNWVVSFKPDYYRTFFKVRIAESKKILKKLRPYILEETKHFSEERKRKDLESELGRFFKGWYLK